jgi:predicted  nucleic acid-binding Zn-ribbon protein
MGKKDDLPPIRARTMHGAGKMMLQARPLNGHGHEPHIIGSSKNAAMEEAAQALRDIQTLRDGLQQSQRALARINKLIEGYREQMQRSGLAIDHPFRAQIEVVLDSIDKELKPQ